MGGLQTNIRSHPIKVSFELLKVIHLPAAVFQEFDKVIVFVGDDTTYFTTR
jgi:hypothetical protein